MMSIVRQRAEQAIEAEVQVQVASRELRLTYTMCNKPRGFPSTCSRSICVEGKNRSTLSQKGLRRLGPDQIGVEKQHRQKMAASCPQGAPLFHDS